MSDHTEPTTYDDAHRHAKAILERDLWNQSEAALDVISPALWNMALGAGALLDPKPDGRRPLPRRALRKPQVAGEVAVVLQIEGITDRTPETMADLRCRVRRQWSFPRRWLRRRREPVWRDLATYDVRDLSAPTVHLIEDLRIVVASGIRTRSTDSG